MAAAVDAGDRLILAAGIALGAPTDLTVDLAGAVAAACLGSAGAGALVGAFFMNGERPLVCDLGNSVVGLCTCVGVGAACFGNAATRGFAETHWCFEADLARAEGTDNLPALPCCLTVAKPALPEELEGLAPLALLLGLLPETVHALAAVLSFEAGPLAAVLALESGACLAAGGALGFWESLLRSAACGGSESAWALLTPGLTADRDLLVPGATLPQTLAPILAAAAAVTADNEEGFCFLRAGCGTGDSDLARLAEPCLSCEGVSLSAEALRPLARGLPRSAMPLCPLGATATTALPLSAGVALPVLCPAFPCKPDPSV